MKTPQSAVNQTSLDVVPNLQHAKRLAGMALAVAAISWLALMILAKILPQYAIPIHILMLAAEAGVVGGLADWYAITVLFRNPFGRLPLPKLLRDHTEIIPRNKARIAESMGRFVQENFLSPTIVARTLQHNDVSLMAGQWLAQPQNSQRIVELVQQGVPKFFEFIGQAQIRRFIQDNSIQWLKNTQINRISSEMLRSILDNDFHQAVLQRGLDWARQWVKDNPQKTYALTKRLFEEMGFGTLSGVANFFGYDVQQKAINGFIAKVEQLLSDPQHPYRIAIEEAAHHIMQQLAEDDSSISQRLNAGKNTLLDSPQLLDFISSAVGILCQAISEDLQRTPSGIAHNLNAVMMQIGDNITTNRPVREVLNQRISDLATELSRDYSDKIINFISQRIHEWDSREMIDKIETEVGGDLHMIRVNGVVVGGFIGLLLGIIRELVNYAF